MQLRNPVAPSGDAFSNDLPLSGERYTSTEYAALEWDRMWTKVWLLLGRAQEMPEPGDYQVEEVGPESVLMIRQRNGAIRAFYNVCQHRGNRLAHGTEGSQPAFSCAYHNWKFDLDGTLLSVPDPENFMAGNPCGKTRLVEIACEVFAGFVWVNMDPDCGTLKEYLGPVWDQWQAYPIADMKRYLALTATMPCNWKIVHDNFAESYHVQTVHPEAKWFVEDTYHLAVNETFPEGHGRTQVPVHTLAARMRDKEEPELLSAKAATLRRAMQRWDLDPVAFIGKEDQIRTAIQRQKRELGPARGYPHYDKLSDNQLSDIHHYTIFPNFHSSITSDTLHYLRARPHPTDPAQCIFDHWFYALVPPDGIDTVMTTAGEVPKHAEVEHKVFKYQEHTLGPVVDQDTGIMADQQLGFRSRGYRGAILSNEEGRLLHNHDVIDEYIAGIRPSRRTK